MIAVYPGSFDPVTYGHLDIIGRAARLADTLVVAILENYRKEPLFSADERIVQLKTLCAQAQWDNIEVAVFSGLLVDFARAVGADAVVRGLRNPTDFLYEAGMSQANQYMAPEVETLFLLTRPEYAYFSSSLVKEIAAHGGDIANQVPPVIAEAVRSKMQNAHPRED